MKPSALLRHLTASIPQKLQSLIVGPPGGGKTALFNQACAICDAEPIIWHPAVSDPTDYKGMPAVTNGGTEAHFLPFGDLMRIINANRLTAVLVDDLGQAPFSVQAALMQLLHGGRLNGHQISEHVVFIGATNDTSHRAAVNGIIEPVKSRFDTIVNLEVSVDDWVDWALKHDVPEELVGFIRFRPDLLCKFEPTRDLTNSPCPRTVTAAGKWIKAGITDHDTLAGAAGAGFAAELLGFLRVFQHLPSIPQILREPGTAPIPRDPSGLFAVCAALTRKFNAQNAAPIFIYLARLPKEHQMLLVRDAQRANPDLTGTKPYIDWAIRNANALQ